MATNNSVNVGLSGSTGTGTFVGSTSPTLVTPILGAATATSLAFSPTTGGIIGTTVADNASAGNVGEFISSSVLVGSAINLTSGVKVNVTTISLTAGDWDVRASVVFNPGTTTTYQFFAGAISTTSAVFPTQGAENNQFTVNGTFPAGLGTQILAIGPMRINISSTNTVYLVSYSVFSVSTMQTYGFISARRIR